MLTGLTRELRWRDVADELPQELQFVFAAYLTPSINLEEPDMPASRSAYWNGHEFLDDRTLHPLHAVTHWMPYPETPDEDEMRRVYAEIVGGGD